MKRSQQTIQLLMILVLCAGLLAPAAWQAQARPARVQAALAEIAAAAPEELVQVIVQKAGTSSQAEDLVKRLGGQVTRDFDFIHSFAAELPGAAVTRLGRSAAVEWVALDAPMAFSQTGTETVRDEFTQQTYTGTDGTTPWSAGWFELGETTNPTSGRVRVVSSSKCAGGYCLRIGGDEVSINNRGAGRAVDLSQASMATLSFEYRRYLLGDEGGRVTLEISADGGVSWTSLATYEFDSSDGSQQSQTFDISAFTAADTQIRFMGAGSDVEGYFYVDNVQIEFSTDGAAPAPTPTVEPPTASAVRDEFNTVSYTNNDGTADWLTSWDENDYGSDSPSAGYIFIQNNRLAFHYVFTGRSIQRQADLSGSTTATLSFDWETVGLDSGEDISVLVSAGSEAPFVELDRLGGSQSGHASYNISYYISPNTTIKFENQSTTWESGEYVYFDNVQIEYLFPPELPNTYLDTTRAAGLHAQGLTGQGITVAVIDSGIDPHPDFGGRLLAAPLGAGDAYGHGTHVAGIIGGRFTGVAPEANLINLQVSDASGTAYESDVVAALQWVHDNQALYDIRVVNMSLNSTVEDSYHNSGINAAVEILWLNGVVVVASAGNFNSIWDWNTINAAPANDPFIITVGASEEHGDADLANDNVGLFSAWGWTAEGHFKPEIIAPGKDIYSTLATSSSWLEQHPDRVLYEQYIRLSGTSMAAPMVSGAAALLLQADPTLTPDQVKDHLLSCSNTIGWLHDYAYLDLGQAVNCSASAPANDGLTPHMLLAKMAMIAYWASQNGAENIDWGNVNWDAVNWDSVNWDSVNWDSVNWDSVNWDSVNWDSVNWDSVNWDSVNWNAVNWNAVNWNAVNWNAVNWNAGGMNFLQGNNGSRQATMERGFSHGTGLFWDDGPGLACPPPVVEKGAAGPTECQIQPVIEK